MDDSQGLDLALLIIADQSIECYSPSLPVSVAAPHCLNAAHSWSVPIPVVTRAYCCATRSSDTAPGRATKAHPA
jgi:hypothetical protein